MKYTAILLAPVALTALGYGLMTWAMAEVGRAVHNLGDIETDWDD